VVAFGKLGHSCGGFSPFFGAQMHNTQLTWFGVEPTNQFNPMKVDELIMVRIIRYSF
jgi:hypothetical protein